MNEMKAAIVYRKQEAKYAHLMSNLISAHAEYKVYEWDEKVWSDNKAKYSSSEHVIFIGDAGKEYKLGTEWIYDEFGMRYGWCGTKCILEVKPLPAKSVKDFREHYENRAKHFKAMSSRTRVDGKPFLIATVANIFSPLAGGIIAYLIAKKIVDTTEFAEHQYQLLIYEFVLEGGLKKFMGD